MTCLDLFESEKKIRKQSLESASNCSNTHYRECLLIQHHLFSNSNECVLQCYANVCVLSKPQLFFVLFVYIVDVNNVIFRYCILIVILLVFRSISVPDVTRASSRRLQKTPGELFNGCTSSFVASSGMLQLLHCQINMAALSVHFVVCKEVYCHLYSQHHPMGMRS